MKFSPTATLALVLAAGLTGAVSAQTINARINPRAQSFAAEAQRYTNQVQEAQERLYAAGLYKGPADGIMELDTRAALTRFQEQNGLQRTGRIDRPTMARLMGGPPTNTGSSQPSSEPAPAGAGRNTASRR